MTVISKDVLFELFDILDGTVEPNIFTASIETTTRNSFWGTHVKLKITESQIGKGVLITLFRDGHVTIKPTSTFSPPGDAIPMTVMQEAPLPSHRVESNGTKMPIEVESNLGVVQLLNLIVEQYPVLKNLNRLKLVGLTNTPIEEGIV